MRPCKDKYSTQKGTWNHQPVRFAAIGLANTALSYSIFFLVISLGANHWIANFFALFIGIIFSFKTGGAIVFRNPDPGLWKRFFFVWIFIYIAISILIGIFIEFGINASISGIIALPFSAFLSYFLQKFFVFDR